MKLSFVAAAGLTFATLFAIAPSQGADMPELKLALADGTINPTPGSAFQLAASLGFFEKHGVKVDIVELNGTPQAVAALNSGAVDLADISIDSVIRLRADNGVALRGIIGSGIGSPFLVAAKDEIKTPADLVGKGFAIANRGSLDQNLTLTWLKGLNIDQGGLNWVPIGPPATRVQALAAGRIDATSVSFGTYQSIAGTPGIHILAMPDDFGKFGPQLSKFVSALDTTIASKHDAIQRFTDAMLDASRTLQANPDQWVAAMSTARDDLKKESLEATAKFFANDWCVNGCLNQTMLAKTVQYIYGSPDFADVKKLGLTDLVDPSFVAKSIESIGASKAGIDVP